MTLHPAYRSLNKPRLILRCEVRLFVFVVLCSLVFTNLAGSFLAGLLSFYLFLKGGQWVTKRDPKLLEFIFRASETYPVYEAAGWWPAECEIVRDAGSSFNS